MDYSEFIKLNEFMQFKNNGIKIADGYNMPLYYQDALNKFEHICYYLQSQEYIQIIKDRRYRFMLIDFEDDQVCMVYKITEIMGSKSIKIIGLPVSKLNNDDNIKKVINKMYCLNFPVSILVSEEEKNDFNFNNIKESKQDFNYYSSYNYVINKFTKKYKKTHKLRNLEKVSSYIVVQTPTKEQKDEIIQLHDEWASCKQGVGGKREFKNTINYLGENIYYLMLYYQTELVAVEIMIKQGNNFMSIFGFHKSRNKNDDAIRNRDLTNIGLYVQYIAVLYIKQQFNSERLYILGARPTEKSLLEYKERTNEDKNKYYIITKEKWSKYYNMTQQND